MWRVTLLVWVSARSAMVGCRECCRVRVGCRALGVGDHRRPAPARGESSGQWCGPHTWVVGHGRWGARLAAALGASV